MDAYHVVLYFHILSLVLAFVAAPLLQFCLFRLRAATTLADAAPWGMLAGKIEKVFPVAFLGLFGTGAYMTSDVWGWGTHWIDDTFQLAWKVVRPWSVGSRPRSVWAPLPHCSVMQHWYGAPAGSGRCCRSPATCSVSS